jgi:hypothetical protein
LGFRILRAFRALIVLAMKALQFGIDHIISLQEKLRGSSFRVSLFSFFLGVSEKNRK